MTHVNQLSMYLFLYLYLMFVRYLYFSVNTKIDTYLVDSRRSFTLNCYKIFFQCSNGKTEIFFFRILKFWNWLKAFFTFSNFDVLLSFCSRTAQMMLKIVIITFSRQCCKQAWQICYTQRLIVNKFEYKMPQWITKQNVF